MDFLIYELVSDDFKLNVRTSDSNKFAISIGRAYHDSDSKTYNLNFDIGLFRLIYDALYIVLSNNTFFKGIGFSDGQFKIPTIEVPNWAALDMAIGNNDLVYFDEERVELHKFLYTLCLHFIARHEVRHIANGHIDYLAGTGRKLFFENAKNGLSCLDSQTLEMDVDSCVCAGLVNGFLNISKTKEFIPKTLHSIEGMFYSLLFALKMLFFCLPSKKISSLAEAQISSHPNSSMRYFFSFTAGLSFIQEYHPDLADTFGIIYQSSWTDFNELDKQGLLKVDKVISDYEWTMSDEGFEYMGKVWNNWNNWIPKLKPFAYLELAPEN